MIPLPEERTSEASLERGHDEKGGWKGRDFVQALGSHERWEEERGKAAHGSWRWAGGRLDTGKASE